jgi:hypothetical protein
MSRLEDYVISHKDLFTRVIQTIEIEFMGIIKRQAVLGRAIIRTENSVFQKPLALDICLGSVFLMNDSKLMLLFRLIFGTRIHRCSRCSKKCKPLCNYLVGKLTFPIQLVADRVEDGKILHRVVRVFEFGKLLGRSSKSVHGWISSRYLF